MTFEQLESYYGVGKSYFCSLKRNNIDTFRFIFGDDEEKRLRKQKIEKYLETRDELISKAVDIYYSFERPIHLNKFLVEHKLYGNHLTSSVAFEKLIFKEYKLVLQERVFNKLKQVIDIYEKEYGCLKCG